MQPRRPLKDAAWLEAATSGHTLGPEALGPAGWPGREPAPPTFANREGGTETEGGGSARDGKGSAGAQSAQFRRPHIRRLCLFLGPLKEQDWEQHLFSLVRMFPLPFLR